MSLRNGRAPSGLATESAAALRARLTEARDVVAVQREDARARRAQDTDHRVAIADVDERAATAERARRERAREAAGAAALAELYRHAVRAGERARVRADIERSAEMRALRVAAVRRGALIVGLPVLAGFAAWSTTGVQAGMVRLLHLGHLSAGWWAAWIVEPLLIAVVAGLIIVRAVLCSSGGTTDRRADVAEWTALATSIALNMLGGWSGQTGWSVVGETLGHSVGAIGAAGTAWLIGVVVDYASTARPWDNAPRLADLDLTALTAPVGGAAVVSVTSPAPVEPPAPTPAPAPAARPAATRQPVEKTPAAKKRQPSAAERVARAAARTPDASAAQLAARLGLSERTVQRHMPKAGVDSVSSGTTPELAAA